MSLEPDAKRRDAWFFNWRRHNADWRYRAAFSQEVDESERAAPTMRQPRGFDQFAALALDRTAAVMLGEALDNGFVHIVTPDARQTKPNRKMFGFRARAASIEQAISDGFQMADEVGEMPVDIVDVVDGWNLAAILQKPHEAANAADIIRAFELVRAVTPAAAPMSREAIDNRVVHTDHRDAASIEPQQKMTRGAAVTAKRRL